MLQHFAPSSSVLGPDVIALTGLPVFLCFGVPKIDYTWSFVKASTGLIGRLEPFYIDVIMLCIQFERFSIKKGDGGGSFRLSAFSNIALAIK